MEADITANIWGVYVESLQLQNAQLLYRELECTEMEGMVTHLSF